MVLKHVSLLLLLLLAPAVRQSAAAADVPLEITAEDVMRRVRANLPQHPVRITGRLRSGPLHSGFDNNFNVEINLDLGRKPALAGYLLRDRFGALLEQMTVMLHAPGAVEWQYQDGAQAPPPLYEHIRRTDLTWSDLALSFLWWPARALTGFDSFRGRSCYVIDLAAPATVDAARPGETRRIWIDEKMFVLLQMEVRENDSLVRRLTVRSFQKINGQWMVKDMEMRSPEQARRTILSVDDVLSMTPSPADPPDAEDL
ncbi:MAG: outer membrane lipoprotein-sorting protein [Kiritimatiellia bacterium]|nr:outer membrane lipoprotein-sorting protein [Lentisphaerota bacterium]